jgi:alpha-tubulin suppressor-like RCC1 family protein
MRARWLGVVAAPLTLGSCGLVLGIEEHEPFPKSDDASDELASSVDARAGEAAADDARGDERPIEAGATDGGSLADTGRDDGAVSPGPPVIAVAAGGGHGCLLRVDGTVGCWGNDEYESLGSDPAGEGTCGSHPCRVAPRPVAGLSGVTQIAAGRAATCALRGDGTVLCWGANDAGQLGHSGGDHSCLGGTPCNWSASLVTSLPSVVQISVGESHACARTSAGALYCWGDDTFGQLGGGATGTQSSKPVAVHLTGAIDVSASGKGRHSCAVKNDGTAWCWGANVRGELGHDPSADKACPDPDAPGTTVPCNVAPIQIKDAADHPIAGMTSMHAGHQATCAQTQSGAVLCWGDNGMGQLGRGGWDVSINHLPAPVTGVSAAASLDTSATIACAIDGAKSLWCWGDDAWRAASGGAVGSGACESGLSCMTAPTNIQAIGAVLRVSAGGEHVVALANDGSVWTWGASYDGRLGHLPGTAGDVDECPVGGDGGMACHPSPAAVPGVP